MRAAIPPLPQYAFMTWYSEKKHRDDFSFYAAFLKKETAWSSETLHSVTTQKTST
jgi:hypothetical protein